MTELEVERRDQDELLKQVKENLNDMRKQRESLTSEVH